MASLPPKPPSPSRDHDRPIPPASQPLSDRISPIDRSYPRPPRPPPCDTYIASYENDRRRDLPARRHEPYGRPFPGRLRDVDRERNGYWERDREWDRERDRDRDRDRERDRERERERGRERERERERERRDWERSRDWERERERNRDRDRTWDRERQYRPADARYYPSTSRRIDDIPYDRRRPYRRSPPPYSASDSSYPRPSPRPRCSRSPARRRPSSRGPPSPPPSPYRPSSPPFKRIRLGNHAIDASPRSPRSPSQSPPRKLHRLPPSDIKNSIEDSIPDVPAATIEPEHSLLPASSLQSTLPSSSLSLQANSRAILEKAASADCSAAPQPVIQTDSKENNSGNSTPIPLIKQETRSSPAITDIKPSSPHLVVKPERIEPDIKVEASSIVATVQDSVSSPTIFGNSLITSQQPRAPNFLLNISTAGTTSDTIRPHRSPPRGPRGHPKAVSSVSAAQAFPTGPRSRRPFAASSVQSANSPIDNIYKSPQDAEIGLVLPPLPVLPKKDAAISLLEQDIARVEAHRSHLANEYAQISKNTRRALHELDISLIDLRAAESRRKVADSQLEKAKTGTLGIYFLPSHSSSNMQVV